MAQKKSEFDKVFSAWDILVIAFGAMIGWGWVVSSGGWIEAGGAVGAAIGFAIGGVMIFFVGLTYAELTAAMPQCGGEHVFSHRAMGANGSFICTWGIILGYVGVACFESCAFPTILTYLWPGFLKGYLYTVAGFDIYASWLAVAVILAFAIMLINILGAKTAAILQTVLTVIIGGAGILLIVASVINGSVDNLSGQMFVGSTGGSMVKNILAVAVVTPFYQCSAEKNWKNDDPVCGFGSYLLCIGDFGGRLCFRWKCNCSIGKWKRSCDSGCDGSSI